VHPATKNLPEELWNALQQIGCTRTYEAGAILFSQQVESEGVYLVERGAITIQMSLPTQQLSQTAGPGTLLASVKLYLATPTNSTPLLAKIASSVS
jgi:CRP-like cAMP-binding protein